MQLKSFRVRKFRNIEDSGEVKLLDALTCVVGKNQAGKSALLRALHKFNPHLPAPYDMRREWPRGQRTKRDKKQVVCEVRFTLSPEELEKLGEIAGQELSVANVVVAKDYEGNFEIRFPEDSTLFPGVLPPNSIDAICHTLPEPTEPVGENFRAEVTKCILEVKRYAKDGRFEELTLRVRARHAAALKKQLTEEEYRASAGKRKPVHWGLQGEADEGQSQARRRAHETSEGPRLHSLPASHVHLHG